MANHGGVRGVLGVTLGSVLLLFAVEILPGAIGGMVVGERVLAGSVARAAAPVPGTPVFGTPVLGIPVVKRVQNPLTPLQVKQVVWIDGLPAALLLDPEARQFLVIFIDLAMAATISQGLLGERPGRPRTHDRITALINRLGGKVRQVTITQPTHNTYHALISVQINGKMEQIDLRPSDALAIAVRLHTPLFGASTLLKPYRPRAGRRKRDRVRPRERSPEDDSTSRSKPPYTKEPSQTRI